MRRWHLPLCLVIGLAVRVPFWIEALRTPVDADTAIVGLMARHPGVGLTMWGQPYGSPLDSWVALPFVAALGPTVEALRFPVFFLGLALIAVAYLLAGALHRTAAFPAALLVACPPPYFLLLAAMPPPFYATTLVLCGLVLWLALRLGARLELTGSAPRGLLAVWGVVAGTALWTHLMSAGAILPALGWLLAKGLRRSRRTAWLLVPLVLTSAPWWVRAVIDRAANRMVAISSREEGVLDHLAVTAARLHEPLGAVFGTHTPVVADSPEFVVRQACGVAAALVLAWGLMLVLAARKAEWRGGATLLFLVMGCVVLAFPFPLRSGPHTVRFLTPAFLPAACLVAWVFAQVGRGRRALVVVLSLASLHLLGALPLLASWRSTARDEAPFLLSDLGPVQQYLEEHGLRHAYASYGPAYRMTWESGERIVASQPWNERFRHYPLPLLDEVRFAKDVAWVLTPDVPSDLPLPAAFEDALGKTGGAARRVSLGGAVVYHGFIPPYSPEVAPLAAAGRAGDGNLSTAIHPDRTTPTTFVLGERRALDGIALVGPLDGPRLLRSMDVAVSEDGVAFVNVAERRRRAERDDLRWVNGHPQYVLDHDLVAIPLGGRTVAAVRITPYASGDEWGLAELLLHPATPGIRGEPWSEWLKTSGDWAERRRALIADPRPDREDWYWRRLVAERHR